MLNFPGSPTSGDFYSHGVRTWKWNTAAWEVVPGAIDATTLNSQSGDYYLDYASMTGTSTGDLGWHTDDATIHFTTGEIDHNLIQNVGTNSHADIDNHFTDEANPHSVVASDVGAPTTGDYAYLSGLYDTHQGVGTIHFTEGSIDHGSIAGLSDDDHTGYIKEDGSRGFSAVVERVDPTTDVHLATRGYVLSEITSSNSGVTTGVFNAHTGETTIHFVQGDISIPSSQISDFTTAVQDTPCSVSSTETATSWAASGAYHNDRFVPLNAGAGNIQFNLPVANTVSGRMQTIKRIDSTANSMLITGDSSTLIDGDLTFTLYKQWDSVTIVAGTGQWFVESYHFE